MVRLRFLTVAAVVAVGLLAAPLLAHGPQSGAKPTVSKSGYMFLDFWFLAGYDYNPARIGQRMDEYGGGATAYIRTRTGTDRYKVEIIKNGKPRAHTLKLVKGEAPGVWLVDGLAAQS